MIIISLFGRCVDCALTAPEGWVLKDGFYLRIPGLFTHTRLCACTRESVSLPTLPPLPHTRTSLFYPNPQVNFIDRQPPVPCPRHWAPASQFPLMDHLGEPRVGPSSSSCRTLQRGYCHGNEGASLKLMALISRDRCDQPDDRLGP